MQTFKYCSFCITNNHSMQLLFSHPDDPPKNHFLHIGFSGLMRTRQCHNSKSTYLSERIYSACATKYLIISWCVWMKIFSMWATTYMNCLRFLYFDSICFEIWLCPRKILTYYILLLTIFFCFLHYCKFWIDFFDAKGKVFPSFTYGTKKQAKLHRHFLEGNNWGNGQSWNLSLKWYFSLKYLTSNCSVALKESPLGREDIQDMKKWIFCVAFA